MRPEPQLGPTQQARAIELLERLPWGDIDGALRAIEEALRLAMEATRDEFQSWEADLGPTLEEEHDWDEFSLPANEVAAMTIEDKLAYVARLLRSLAMAYGVTTDYSARSGERPAVGGEHSPNTPAELLRGLNDILWMPMIDR